MVQDPPVCWEALDPVGPELRRARRLYEATLPAAERIPWDWIEQAVASRRTWRPGAWSGHLLLAGPRRPRAQARAVFGLAYGLHVPAYGAYACYLSVDPAQRGRGLGTRLLRLLVRMFEVDAACEGTPLPFVVWESRPPGSDARPEERVLWQARLRLFERAGARWVSGLTFLAPNFAHRYEGPVPLQLFLLPEDMPAEQFTPEALRDVAAGLLTGVYGRRPGDPLFEQTLPPGCRPALRPVTAFASHARTARGRR